MTSQIFSTARQERAARTALEFLFPTLEKEAEQYMIGS